PEACYVVKNWRLGNKSFGAPSVVHNALIIANNETTSLAELLKSRIPDAEIHFVNHPKSMATLLQRDMKVYDCWIDIVGCAENEVEHTQWLESLQKFVDQASKI